MGAVQCSLTLARQASESEAVGEGAYLGDGWAARGWARSFISWVCQSEVSKADNQGAWCSPDCARSFLAVRHNFLFLLLLTSRLHPRSTSFFPSIFRCSLFSFSTSQHLFHPSPSSRFHPPFTSTITMQTIKCVVVGGKYSVHSLSLCQL